MVTLKRSSNTDYADYDFFKAVTDLIDKPAPDFCTNQRSDQIHFLAHSSISFPPSDICSIKQSEHELTFVLSFMSLCGTNSPLPDYFLDFFSRCSEKSSSFYDFLMIFNQRIYSLFYLVWKKYNIIQNLISPEKNRLINRFALLCGHWPANCNDKNTGNFNFSTHLICSKSKASLQKYLDFFFEGVPVRIEEFVPSRTTVSNIHPLGNQCILGVTTVLGTEISSLTSKFRIIAGPVSYDYYKQVLSGSFDFGTLIKIIDSFAHLLEYEIIFLMKFKDLIPVTIGNHTVGLGKCSSLGLSSMADSQNCVQIYRIQKDISDRVS